MLQQASGRAVRLLRWFSRHMINTVRKVEQGPCLVYIPYGDSQMRATMICVRRASPYGLAENRH